MTKPNILSQLIRGLYLASLMFGLVAWVMLPFLIMEVRAVRLNGKSVDVEVMSSYVYYQGKNCSLNITFKTKNDEELTIGNALPGDIATCGGKDRVAGNINTGANKFILAGDKYYVEQGEYWWSLSIALLGSLPYLYLFYSMARRKT